MNDWIKIEPEDTGDTIRWDEVKEVEGKFVKFDENVGQNNSTIYTLEKEDGTKVSMWGSTVLDSRMQMIPLGAEIKIVYKGYVKSEKTGREYKNFEVYRRETAPPEVKKK